jgi:DNA polymerase III epsilon subunit-like protein
MNDQQVKTFVLHRTQDPTGISGTGIVAAGCVLPSGKVVLEWRGPRASITIHDTLDNVTAIHCHNGATVIEWDPEPIPVLAPAPDLSQPPTVETVEEAVNELERDKRTAAQWARDLLAAGTFVIVDTETTGLESDDQIIQIGIVDPTGAVLLDQLIKPTKPITNTAWHGLTDDSVKDAPGFPAVHEAIRAVLDGKTFVAYNAPYDTRMLNQVCAQHGLAALRWAGADCVMEHFAAFYGEWNDYHGNYRWQKLKAAAAHFGLTWDGKEHNAVADCKMTLAVLKKMAAYKAEPQVIGISVLPRD